VNVGDVDIVAGDALLQSYHSRLQSSLSSLAPSRSMLWCVYRRWHEKKSQQFNAWRQVGPRLTAINYIH